MPTISKLATQKRNPDLVSIYLDGKFTLSLNVMDVEKEGLARGKELSGEQVEHLQKRYGFQKAINYAMHHLKFRSRTSHEISEYLLRKGFEKDVAEEVVTHLEEKKYLNDHEFARLWASDRLRFRPRSLYRLRGELYKLGIDKQLVDEVLAESPEYEQEALKNTIKQKSPLYRDKQKFLQYLVRQGYGYHQVKQAMESDD